MSFPTPSVWSVSSLGGVTVWKEQRSDVSSVRENVSRLSSPVGNFGNRSTDCALFSEYWSTCFSDCSFLVCSTCLFCIQHLSVGWWTALGAAVLCSVCFSRRKGESCQNPTLILQSTWIFICLGFSLYKLKAWKPSLLVMWQSCSVVVFVHPDRRANLLHQPQGCALPSAIPVWPCAHVSEVLPPYRQPSYRLHKQSSARLHSLTFLRITLP